MIRPHLVALLLVLFALVACDLFSTPEEEVTRFVSIGGTTVVVNPEDPVPADRLGWSLREVAREPVSPGSPAEAPDLPPGVDDGELPGTVRAWATGPDGRIWVHVVTGGATSEAGAGAPEHLLLTTPSGSSTDPVAADESAVTVDTFLVLGADRSITDPPVPEALRRRWIWTVLTDGRVAVVSTAESRVRFWEGDGRSGATATAPEVREALPEGAIVRLGGGVTVPDSMPSYAELWSGPEGSVWARRPLRFEEWLSGSDTVPSAVPIPGGGDWDVFAGSGEYLGSVELPPDLVWERTVPGRLVGSFSTAEGATVRVTYRWERIPTPPSGS